jgi:hypothetical protein
MIARVDAVTSDDIAAEAERLFDGRVISMAVVGNVGKLPITAPDLATSLNA